MDTNLPVERLVNLLDPFGNVLLNMTESEALQRLATGDPQQVREIDGQYALVAKQGQTVRMARSIGRPMRYFLAKRAAGPCLIVAERIDEIHDALQAEGLDDQFHPSYTRMVPAHYVLELQLIGCPDPNPTTRRYLQPSAATLSADLDVIGRAYVGAVAAGLDDWLGQIDAREPIGLLFSGGVDSGSLLLLLEHLIRQRGESPARLKAFTLTVDETGSDLEQARNFVETVGMAMLLEPVAVERDAVDFRAAVRSLEDYKPLDVQAGAMALSLCKGIRRRYPKWRYLVNGDGGDENLKDYPIEENPELTIRSVLNNRLLYQEGWGVEAVKHSLTYSGGQSRGHVRTHAPARQMGFDGFTPFALPKVIDVAARIPFIELTDWDHQRLYALKGDVVRRGVLAITGKEMPVFEKQRFQKGAVAAEKFDALFPSDELTYRREFAAIYE